MFSKVYISYKYYTQTSFPTMLNILVLLVKEQQQKDGQIGAHKLNEMGTQNMK